MNNASQTCQDVSGLLKVLISERKNEKCYSTEDLYFESK